MSIDILGSYVDFELERLVNLGDDPVLFRDGGRLSSVDSPNETLNDTAVTVNYLLWRLEHSEMNRIRDKEYLAMLGGVVLQLDEKRKETPKADEVFELAANGLLRSAASRNDLKDMLHDDSVNRRLVPALATASDHFAQQDDFDKQLELLTDVQQTLDTLENQPTAAMPQVL